MRHAARIDRNQPDIVKALRRVPGVTVQPLSSVGHGVPDLLVGTMLACLQCGLRAKANLLLEVKDGDKVPSAQVLTPDQVIWHAHWTGQVEVVKSIDEAFEVCGMVVR